ncbi:DUF3467 domain-containing protein [Candidatus Marinamargulisbacteria bacterium SCGC AG-343-K17]|nr:DUF3467 domain-containing protein [Candidatus Marinamargulisbacteria bacterium SCGC AG-343-K17]
MNPQENDRIPIQCPSELANGVYANLGVANFNHEEFVLDFIFLHPNTKTGEVRSRVVLHPDHVRRLVNMLKKNLDNYDEQFHGDGSDGDDMGDDDFPPITLNFN